MASGCERAGDTGSRHRAGFHRHLARAGCRRARLAFHPGHGTPASGTALLPFEPAISVARSGSRRNAQLCRARTADRGTGGPASAGARLAHTPCAAFRARHRTGSQCLAGRPALTGIVASGLASFQWRLRMASAGRLTRLTRRILPPIAIAVLLAAALVLANDAAGGSNRFAGSYAWILGASVLALLALIAIIVRRL